VVERDQRATVVATSGFAEELEDAKAAIAENWRKWLALAKLTELP
jgi:hypothetical protein